MGYEIETVDVESCRLKVAWEGAWEIDDAKGYFEDLKIKIGKFNGKSWTLIIDQANFKQATQDASKILIETGKWMLENRMDKASVITGNSVGKLQMTRMSMESGIYKKQKYVNNEQRAKEFVGWS